MDRQGLRASSAVRDGMHISWNVAVPMADGAIMSCDIYRPTGDTIVPALTTYGPYGKGLHFEDGYPTAWHGLVAAHPEVVEGSSSLYQSWETPDPEKWVPLGYACVRFDSRGTGCSPGYLNHFSAQEAADYAECIEWVAQQSWCTGKVGTTGISYYAMMSWAAAALRPKGLAAALIFEGAVDIYRDQTRHGGILSTMPGNWYDMQIAKLQHGYGDRGFKSRVTGELVCGDETLPEETLRANRIEYAATLRKEIFDTDYYTSRTPDVRQIEVPLLSCGNWGGQGLHLRGNIEGYLAAGSKQKWLEMHGLEHWTHFMTDYGMDLQRRFFGHFLKGEDTGWDDQPNVQLQIRHPGERFEVRAATQWPLPDTQWQKLFLDADTCLLSDTPPLGETAAGYDAMGDGITFKTEPLAEALEITGPLAATLHVSSSTQDADLFVILRAFAPDGSEVTFQGAIDPHTPLANGWLRASHRAVDRERSLPFRPWHPHDGVQLLIPGEIVTAEVEILPTSIVLPAGYQLALTIRGSDFEGDFPTTAQSNFKNSFKGSGPFLHDDPEDRPPAIFNNRVTIHSEPGRPSFLLLPVIAR